MEGLKKSVEVKRTIAFKKGCPYVCNRKKIQPSSETDEDWDPFPGLKSENLGHCICYGICGEKVEHECCSDPYGFPLYFNLGCLDSHVDGEISMTLLSHTDKGVYIISNTGISKYFSDGDYEIPISTVDEFIDSIYSDIRNGQNKL